MIDTVAVKHYIARPPTKEVLLSLGWQPRYNKRDGTIYAYVRNEPKGSSGPRLTLSQNPKLQWHLKAESSLPKLIHGVNVPLLNEDEIENSLQVFSTFVENWSGITFDLSKSLVCRIDVAKDFYVGESAIVPMIAKCARVQIPRYDRIPYNDESVVFTPKGEKNSKRITLYNKLAEVMRRNGSEEEKESARGIVRLEAGLRTNSISYLASKLKLPGREAPYILTREFADYVLLDAMQKLQFDSLDSEPDEAMEKLITHFGATRARSLIGFIELRKRFGEELFKSTELKFPARTYYRDLSDCRKARVIT